MASLLVDPQLIQDITVVIATCAVSFAAASQLNVQEIWSPSCFLLLVHGAILCYVLCCVHFYALGHVLGQFYALSHVLGYVTCHDVSHVLCTVVIATCAVTSTVAA